MTDADSRWHLIVNTLAERCAGREVECPNCKKALVIPDEAVMRTAKKETGQVVELNEKTADKNATGIEVRVRFFPLGWFLYFCTPTIVVDGTAYPKGWGTHFFQLPPGRHTLKVFFRYLFIRECGANARDVMVEQGQVSKVSYYMLPWMLAKGIMRGGLPSPGRTSNLALVSAHLAVLGVFTAGLLSVPGLVLGIVGLRGIRRSGNTVSGAHLAKAGIWISSICVAVFSTAAVSEYASRLHEQKAIEGTVIEVRSGRTVLLNQKEYQLQELAQVLADQSHSFEETKVTLKADESLSCGYVAEVMRILRAAGIEKLSIPADTEFVVPVVRLRDRLSVASEDDVVIHITSDGRIVVNDMEYDSVDSEELPMLRDMLATLVEVFGKKQSVMVEPHDDAVCGRLLDVLNACADSGVHDISLSQTSNKHGKQQIRPDISQGVPARLTETE